MIATDFIFDGEYLSDYGFMICTFNNDGLETRSNGSVVQFDTVPNTSGSKNNKYGSKYGDPLSATISICLGCEYINTHPKVTQDDVSSIMRWLSRKDNYHTITFLHDDVLADIEYQVKIDVSNHYFGGEIIGFELTITTDKPYAYLSQDDTVISFSANGTYSLEDISDVVGEVYPDLEITMKQNGDFHLTNSQTNETTIITGCTNGEVIKIYGENRIITSTVLTSLPRRFNYVFPRIANTYLERENIFTVTSACDVKIKWKPIKQIGL